MRSYYLLAVCSLALIGCGNQGSTPVGEGEKITDAASKTKAGHVELADFSVDVPPLWRVFDLAAKDFEQSINEFAKAGPSEATLAQSIKGALANKAIKLFAFDFSKAGVEFVDNLNVIVEPAQRGQTAQSLCDDAKKMFANVPNFSKPISFEVQKVGPFECAYGRNKMKNPKGKELGLETYGLIGNGKIYTFSFTCDPKNAERFFGQARQVMASVKLK